MLLLLNSKNEPMKCELSIAYSQGSTDCYPLDPDGMTCLAATQYRVKEKKTPKGTKINGGGSENDQNPEEEPTETLGAHVDTPSDTTGNDLDDGEDDENADNVDGTAAVHHVNDGGKMKLKQYSINELLGTHPIDDPIWDYSDESIGSADSAEDLVGIYTVWDGYDTSDGSDERKKETAWDGYANSDTSDKTSDDDNRKESKDGLNAVISVPGEVKDNTDSNGNGDAYEDDLHMYQNDGDKDNFDPDGNNETFYDSHEELTDDDDNGKANNATNVEYDSIKETHLEARKPSPQCTSSVMSDNSAAQRLSHGQSRVPRIPTPPWIHTDHTRTPDPSNIPLDYNRKSLLKYDMVQIKTKDRWVKAKGRVGKIVSFAEGCGDNTWVTIQVPNIDSPQSSLAKNLELVSRKTVSDVSATMLNFQIGKLRK